MRIILLLLSVLSTGVFAAEICSRVATINYQEVLIDTSSSNRGEGLRYYLDKDPVSKQLLDEYQANNRPTWQSAGLSTLGTGMMVAGLLRTNSGENDGLTGRGPLLVGGAVLIAVSYLLSRTHQITNEHLLKRSVDEYNKRNTPRIFLSPTDPKNGFGMGVGVGKEF